MPLKTFKRTRCTLRVLAVLKLPRHFAVTNFSVCCHLNTELCCLNMTILLSFKSKTQKHRSKICFSLESQIDLLLCLKKSTVILIYKALYGTSLKVATSSQKTAAMLKMTDPRFVQWDIGLVSRKLLVLAVVVPLVQQAHTESKAHCSKNGCLLCLFLPSALASSYVIHNVSFLT